MSTAFKADFKSRELDVLFARWLSGDISEQERAEWKKILMYDTRFREEFCDWIKSLRRTETWTPGH